MLILVDSAMASRLMPQLRRWAAKSGATVQTEWRLILYRYYDGNTRSEGTARPGVGR